MNELFVVGVLFVTAVIAPFVVNGIFNRTARENDRE